MEYRGGVAKIFIGSKWGCSRKRLGTTGAGTSAPQGTVGPGHVRHSGLIPHGGDIRACVLCTSECKINTHTEQQSSPEDEVMNAIKNE